MKRKLTILAVIFVLMMLLLPLLSTAARGDDNQRRTSVEIEGDGNYININSLSANPLQGNEYSVIFTGSTFLVMFKQYAQSQSYDLMFNIQLLNLTLNNNGQNTELINFADQEFYLVSRPVVQNGLFELSVISASHLAVMKMTIVAANSTSLISEPYGNITLTPNEIKLSFEIITGNEDMMDGFFGGGISQNASITLNLRVNATSQIMSANGGAASEISFSQGGNSGYFSWSNSAIVDGQNRPVLSSLSYNVLSLIYPYGHVIIHDPFLGISPSTLSKIAQAVATLTPNILLFASTAAASAIAIAAATVYKKRRL